MADIYAGDLVMVVVWCLIRGLENRISTLDCDELLLCI